MTNQYCANCNWILKILDSCPTLPIQQIFLKNGLKCFNNIQFLYNLFMVFLSIIPWIFCIFIVANFLMKRNSQTCIRFLTHLIANIFCDIVKVLIFREHRPEGACDTNFGMPSCHSIFAGLYTTWIFLELLVYPKMKLSMLIVMQLFLMALVPYSRFFLQYHSQKQVLTGWTIGVIFAIVGWIIFFTKTNQELKTKIQ